LRRAIALVKVCSDTLFIEIHEGSADAETAIERALDVAAIEAGASCVRLGPEVIPHLIPARCYGRVEVRPRGSAQRMCAARDAAVEVLVDAGYEVFGRLTPRRTKVQGAAAAAVSTTAPLYPRNLPGDGGDYAEPEATLPNALAWLLER